jgi:hypothetical protein
MITKKENFQETGDIECNPVRNFFKLYSDGFKNGDLLNDKHIELKCFHTSKVCENIIDIGRSFDMSHEQLNFVEILALLHDIGRFEQYQKYRTFDDSVSENHAVLGLKVLEKEKILYGFSDVQKEIIFRSILNHNTRSVPENEPDSIDFYSRLLRDADKLDIWRVSIEMNIIFKLQEEILPDFYTLPQPSLQSFKERKTLKLEEACTMYDTTIFRLSWIFDLNFIRSFEIFKERKIGQKLLNKVPHSDDLDQIGQLVENYIAEKKLKSIPTILRN